MPENLFTDNQIIEKFLDSVSWGDECEIFYLNDRMLMKSVKSEPNIIFVPCHYENYMEGVATAISIGSLYKLFPWVLMYGDASKENVGHLWHLAHTAWGKAVHVSWVTPIRCSFDWNRMTTRALDGIDWVRSAENVAKGNKKPVWSWDK